MNHLTDELLKIIADYKGKFNGAYSIRENGECVARQSSVNIDIITHCPGNQKKKKLKDTHQQRVQKPGGLEEGCEESSLPVECAAA